MMGLGLWRGVGECLNGNIKLRELLWVSTMYRWVRVTHCEEKKKVDVLYKETRVTTM